MKPTRIGIFGGTFNPIHLGHLRSAEEVGEAQRLDRILFVPSGSPPHKARQGIAAAADRAAMVKLAIAGNRRFRLSTIEIERDGRSYSIDTIRALRESNPGAEFAFIIGIDAFRDIATWKDYRALFNLCDFIVTSRRSQGQKAAQKPGWRELVPVAARSDFWYLPAPTTLKNHAGHQIIFQTLTDLDVSASALRERVAAGLSIRYLVPRTVEQYVKQHNLYAPKGPLH